MYLSVKTSYVVINKGIPQTNTLFGQMCLPVTPTIPLLEAQQEQRSVYAPAVGAGSARGLVSLLSHLRRLHSG